MRTVQKDITENDSGLVIHGTNCQHVMGSGVAKAIRDKWPIVYEKYMEDGSGAEMLGEFRPIKINEELVIGNCYTQEYYGSDGKIYASLDAITESLDKAFEYAKENKLVVKSPLIGCGLGGLKVTEIMPIYHELRAKHDVEVEFYFI